MTLPGLSFYPHSQDAPETPAVVPCAVLMRGEMIALCYYHFKNYIGPDLDFTTSWAHMSEHYHDVVSLMEQQDDISSLLLRPLTASQFDSYIEMKTAPYLVVRAEGPFMTKD